MKRPTVVVLIATLLLAEGLLFMVVTQVASANPDWWDTNWTKRRSITVGAHPENYQIKVEIPSGISENDYPSIRFLENEDTGRLPYWIERDEGSYLNVAWVRRLENSDSTIWMYYGNSGATSAENGDNVFLFFDDFGGGSGGSDNLDHNKWWHSDYSIDVYQYAMRLKVWSGNEGKIEHGESQGLSTEEENTRRVIETRMKNVKTYRGGLLLTGVNWDHEETACIFEKGGGEYRFWSKNFPNTKDGGYLSENNRPGDVWYVLSVDLYGASKDKVQSHFYWGNDNADYRELVEESDELTHDWAPPGDRVDKYGLRVWEDDSEYYFDWFLVRKYVDPEPTATVGPEQSLPGPPQLYSPPNGSTTSDTTPTFEWTIGENAVNHRLLVDNDPDFSSPEENELKLYLYENSYTPTTPLSPDNYSWKVIAINTYGETESSVWTFVVSGPTQENFYTYLENGWNLVGFIIENTPNNIFTGLSYYTDYYLYWYQAPGGPYMLQGPDEVLKDNLGYWVWINRDNMVTVP